MPEVPSEPELPEVPEDPEVPLVPDVPEEPGNPGSPLSPVLANVNTHSSPSVKGFAEEDSIKLIAMVKNVYD